VKPVTTCSLTDPTSGRFNLYFFVFICQSYYLVIIEHECDCDSYGGEVEDISDDESGSDTSVSEAKITDSDSDSSVDIQAQKWVELKNSGLPNSTKHLSRAQDSPG
jgi:hypothetical protein